MIDILPFPSPPAAWTGNFSSESLLSSSFSPALHCHQIWYYFLSSHSPPVQHLDGIKGKMLHSFSLNRRTKWPPIYIPLPLFFQKSTFSGPKYSRFPQNLTRQRPLLNLKGESWHANFGVRKGGLFFQKIRGIKVPEGIWSPTLRMGAWNLNTKRFVSVIGHPFIILWPSVIGIGSLGNSTQEIQIPNFPPW